MTSQLFLIYFYSSFRKNPYKATLNNKLNKTKLKLKKVNPKFKPLGPFFFFLFFPCLFFFFFPIVTVHHLHSSKYPYSPVKTSISCLHCPFRVFFFFFYDVHRINTSFANNGLRNGNQSILSHAFAHSTSICLNVEGIVKEIVEEINGTYSEQNELECLQASVRNLYPFFPNFI